MVIIERELKLLNKLCCHMLSRGGCGWKLMLSNADDHVTTLDTITSLSHFCKPTMQWHRTRSLNPTYKHTIRLSCLYFKVIVVTEVLLLALSLQRLMWDVDDLLGSTYLFLLIILFWSVLHIYKSCRFRKESNIVMDSNRKKHKTLILILTSSSPCIGNTAVKSLR